MEYIYAALLLHKVGQSVTEENLKKVIEATGVQVDDAKVKTLIASLQGVDIAAELENASVATVAAPAAGGDASAGDAGAEKAEEKKQEEKKEESAAGLASLFG